MGKVSVGTQTTSLEPAENVYCPHSGELRQFYTFLPRETVAPRSGWPLIVAFHSETQTPFDFALQTQLSDPLVNSDHIVAFPTEFGFQRSRSRVKAADAQVTDIEFVHQLLKKLSVIYHVDRKRIFLAGLSQGAGLASLIACDPSLSEEICAVGLASLYLFTKEADQQPTFNQFDASRFPLPLLEIHGDADPVNDYNGVDSPDGPNWPIGCWLRDFKEMNEVGIHGYLHWDPAKEDDLYDGQVERFVWRCGCNADVVVHYIIRGFGHGWPTTVPLSPSVENDRQGPAPFNATPLLLDFFRKSAGLQPRRTAASAPS